MKHFSIKAEHPTARFFLPASSPEEALPDTDLIEVPEEAWKIGNSRILCDKPPHWVQLNVLKNSDLWEPDKSWATWFDTRRGGAFHLEHIDTDNFGIQTIFIGASENGEAVIYQTVVMNWSGVGKTWLVIQNSHYPEEAYRTHFETLAQVRAEFAARRK